MTPIVDGATRWSRRAVKATVATTLSVGLRLRGGRQAPPPLVLGYHRVVEDFRARRRDTMPAMLVSRRMLERHLDWVGRHYEFVSLDDLGRALASGRTTPRPLAAVTFDDGYRDVYEHGWPLLQRKGIPAAVFPVTGLVGTTGVLPHDRAFALFRRALRQWAHPRASLGMILGAAGAPGAAVRAVTQAQPDALALTQALLRALPLAHVRAVLDRIAASVGEPEADPSARPLTWDMVEALHRGGVTIGSHTSSHALLGREPIDVVAAELAASRRELERRLGAPVVHFAYPDGRFTRATVSAVGRAGFRFAYTTCAHRDARHPLLTIPRRLLSEESSIDAFGRMSPAILRCQAEGRLFGSAQCSLESHT